MFGAGGSALVAKTMGEGNNKKANSLFSLFVYISALLGVLFSCVGFVFLRPLMEMFGATGVMLEQAILYGNILLVSLPFWNLQFLFQIFFVTAEKPKLGLYVTLIAGVTNMALDALFIAGFEWGIAIMGPAFFTALNNGLVSAILSFLRTIVFQVVCVILFPIIWGIDGIWISIVAAEGLACICAIGFIIALRKKYGYA